MSIIYEVFVEMSLACQGPQQVQCVSGVPCPSMCRVGGWVWYLSFSSAQLSPPLLPVDINKNRQLATKQQGSSAAEETNFRVTAKGLRVVSLRLSVVI